MRGTRRPPLPYKCDLMADLMAEWCLGIVEYEEEAIRGSTRVEAEQQDSA